MRTLKIRVGHIYYVDYEPVRSGEFNRLHLSVVLKRNNDKNTFIVMPLTSSANGDGANKVNIGKVSGLPPSLNQKISYAVFNQVRTGIKDLKICVVLLLELCYTLTEGGVIAPAKVERPERV